MASPKQFPQESCRGYQTIIRPQQTFAIDDRGLACLLTQNVAKPSKVNVNIPAFFLTKVNNKDISLVKIVVGPVNIVTPEDELAQEAQQKQFLKNLDKLGVKYTTQKVIQINNLQATVGTPGQFRKIISALVCEGIKIISSYEGEPSEGCPGPNAGSPIVIVETCKCNIKKAVKVLCNLDLAKVDDPIVGLCINTNNVACKCKSVRNGNPCKSN